MAGLSGRCRSQDKGLGLRRHYSRNARPPRHLYRGRESVMNAAVIDVTGPDFDKEVARSPVPVLVDFTAAWCAPCRTIGPHVDAIAESYAGRVRVGKCDMDSNPDLAARFDVRSIPTLL